jgi:hypothetical protein
MAGSALGPVAAAVFAKVVDLVVAGGLHEDLPERPTTFPLVWLELSGARELAGLGTGSIPELELRTHSYSLAGSRAQGLAIDSLVVARLKGAALQVEGYRQCGSVFYDDTVQLRDVELNGQKVHEVVSSFRIVVEEA